MFNGLEEEIATIKDRAFHVIDGPLPPEKAELVHTSPLDVPSSYKDFVIQFGNAKLYRSGSQYRIQIYAVPGDAEAKDGEQLLNFGKTDSALAYFRVKDLKPGEESPVYEWRHPLGLFKTADGFEEWINSKCRAAREKYSKSQWKAIENGPVPFDEREQEIVRARRQFSWRILGISANSDIRFEIRNNANFTLPYLTVLARSKDDSFHGSIWLPTRSILPGQMETIEVDCYKKFVSPSEIEISSAPDPWPELRDRYWEFKMLC